ncbi:hypothetical protein HAX54_009982 [Datura stramonium]|uniref:Uncharacterized protein n=1 Tax=Datura stramonium TaxID=4076 RepID=A0ABS8TGG1_DATST|nr:hypothetical protein [Datura stramonium]
MEGRVDERKWLQEQLTSQLHNPSSDDKQLKVIPIFGMGGIGKSTLAKELYNDADIRFHFDVWAWATISSTYKEESIAAGILRSLKEEEGELETYKLPYLAGMIKRKLSGDRYLIVIDDIWSRKAWNDVLQWFPDDKNKSRILLTTRIERVARYAGTQGRYLKMDLMNEDECWNLFKSVAFANIEVEPKLEEIGKKIVCKCQRLPLTVVVVAGLLRNSERTIEYWDEISEDVMKFAISDPKKQCEQVLELSYNHLKDHKKKCLLYFVLFPLGHDVLVKRLMRLWMAEEFLEVEKEAKKCLQDLIDRCLVLVGEKCLDEIKSCKVHHLIYELCSREAQKGDFFVINDNSDDTRDKVTGFDEHNSSEDDLEDDDSDYEDDLEEYDDDGDGGVCYKSLLTPNKDENISKQTISIFSRGSHSSSSTPKLELSHFTSLKVLDLSSTKFHKFPTEILELVCLRYLSLYGGKGFKIDPNICRLLNLQTFLASWECLTHVTFTKKIWELFAQLRHLGLDKFYLPRPPASRDPERKLGVSNVQTISGLSLRCCNKEVITGIQNVKKLKIFGDHTEYISFGKSKLLENLVLLCELERLSITFTMPLLWKIKKNLICPSPIAFPETLKKLKLWGTCLKWEDLKIISVLPNLEVLKLVNDACISEKWYSFQGGFTRLKILLIFLVDHLKYWTAEDDDFPVLEHLEIRSCSLLEEIPIGFADIRSLQLIELSNSTPKLDNAAEAIQNKRISSGNKHIHVRIHRSKPVVFDTVKPHLDPRHF